MNSPNEAEWAWVAGLYEGEGCVYAQYKKQPNGSLGLLPAVTIKFGMTDADVLQKAQKITGCGKVRGPYEKFGQKPVYTWEVTRLTEVRFIADHIQLWLCERRLAQLEKALTERANAEQRKPSVEERFWQRVSFGEGEHWWWTGGTSAGSPVFHVGPKQMFSPQRYAWDLFKKPLEKGVHIRRDCDQPACVNPFHWSRKIDPESRQAKAVPSVF